MVNFARINLKAGADPQFVLDYLGINSDNGYGIETLADDSTDLIVQAKDLERTAEAVRSYDALYLEQRLKPTAMERVWNLRRLYLTRMILNGDVLPIDETTISRLTQAKVLLDEAEKRGQPIATIHWELVKFQFVRWPAQVIQDTAYAVGCHIQATFKYQDGLYELIRAATSAERLAQLDLETGWPNQQ